MPYWCSEKYYTFRNINDKYWQNMEITLYDLMLHIRFFKKKSSYKATNAAYSGTMLLA